MMLPFETYGECPCGEVEMRIADALQRARMMRFWSRERLAEAAGVSSATVRRVERGVPVRAETLYQIDRALDGELLRLLGVTE